MATSSSSPTNGVPVESSPTTTESHSTTAIEPRLRASRQLTSTCIERSFTRVPTWRARQMTRPIETVAVLFVMTVAAWSVNTLAAGRTYAIDAERSRAVIAVGKAGALSFAAGHTHEVLTSAITGVVNVETARLAQSTVQLTIDTA